MLHKYRWVQNVAPFRPTNSHFQDTYNISFDLNDKFQRFMFF